MRIHHDERGIVLSWLARIAVVLGVLAVVIYDGGALAVNYFTLDSTADDIAIAVSTDVAAKRRLDPATVDEAKELAAESEAKLMDATLDQDGVVHVKLKRKAKTLVLGHFSFFDEWVKATAEGEAGTT